VGDAGGDGAETILRERYARGELSDEQYEAMRARLSRLPDRMTA
jgi:uncharacterized membrane protein